MGVITQHYRHPTLGHVHILVKPTARSIKAWWKGPMLQVTCPAISASELSRALDKMESRLLDSRPRPRYHIGQQFVFELFSITLRQQSFKPRHILTNYTNNHDFVVSIGTSVDINSEDGENLLDKIICNIAKNIANTNLLNEALTLSRRLNIYPSEGYELGYGRKRLGCCKNARRISLSFMLAFMPRHLREYIICHELAHLTHMDHSPEFHALVNKYTNGNEARLEAELRKFVFPVKR